MELSSFFRDADGNLAVAQGPNPAVLTTVGLGAAARLWPARSDQLRRMTQGALTAWAADEALRGSSPFRRTLGGTALLISLSQLSGSR